MKIKYNFFVLLFLLSLVWSAKATTLSGHLKNTYPQQAQLKFRLLTGHLPLISDNKVIHLDQNGNFQINVNIKQSRFATLEYNDQQILIYLPTNGTLYLSDVATDLLDSAQFDGDASAENRFLKNYLQISYDSLWLKEIQHIGSNNSDLMAWFDGQVNQAQEQLDQIHNKISEESYEKLKEETFYYYTNFILYIDFVDKFKVPLSVRDSLVNGRIQAGYPFVFSPNASNFVELSLYTLEKRIKPDLAFLQEELGVSSEEEVIEIMQGQNIVDFISYKHTLSDSFLERALVNILLYATEHSIYENLPRIHQYFNQNFPNIIFGEQINERMKSAYSALEATNNEEIIFLPEGHSFTSLKEIFDYLNLKEEIVLIDIWGSWCKPCREEFKFIPTVKDRLKDRNLAYLYIADQKSLSNPVEKWKKAVAIHNLIGYHIMMNEHLSEKLIINGYPTYKIVNRKGDILLERAIPPSDTERMVEQLTGFLNE